MTREKCATCNKTLKLTELNLCSCGTPVCARHRCHMDHKCTRVFEHKISDNVKKEKVSKI